MPTAVHKKRTPWPRFSSQNPVSLGGPTMGNNGNWARGNGSNGYLGGWSSRDSEPPVATIWGLGEALTPATPIECEPHAAN
jgi:hypothetical protein